jgi:hypothetical protein
VESLKLFRESVGTDYKKILGFSKTRWLSLYPVITRVLQMFDPLRNYFLSIGKAPKF